MLFKSHGSHGHSVSISLLQAEPRQRQKQLLDLLKQLEVSRAQVSSWQPGPGRASRKTFFNFMKFQNSKNIPAYIHTYILTPLLRWCMIPDSDKQQQQQQQRQRQRQRQPQPQPQPQRPRQQQQPQPQPQRPRQQQQQQQWQRIVDESRTTQPLLLQQPRTWKTSVANSYRCIMRWHWLEHLLLQECWWQKPTKPPEQNQSCMSLLELCGWTKSSRNSSQHTRHVNMDTYLSETPAHLGTCIWNISRKTFCCTKKGMSLHHRKLFESSQTWIQQHWIQRNIG